MIVNYDQTNGWSLFGSKRNLASQEAIGFFDKVAKEQTRGTTITSWDLYAKNAGVADESLNKFLADTKYRTKDLATYNQYLKDTGKATSGFASMTSKAGSVLKSFGAMASNILASMAVSMLISKGIELAAKKWDEYSHSQENAIEKGTKTLEDHKASLQELNTASKLVADSGARFEELSRGVSASGQNISLTSDEFEEYQSIVSQLANSFPELIDGYDSLGNPIITTTNSVRELTDALKEQQKTISQTNVNNAKDYVDAFNAKYNQEAIDFTKESGLRQQRKELEYLVNKINEGGNAAEYFGSKMETGFAGISRFVNIGFEALTNFSITGAIGNFLSSGLFAEDSAMHKIGDFLKITSGGAAGIASVSLEETANKNYVKALLTRQDIAEKAGISQDTIDLANKEITALTSAEDREKIEAANEHINETIAAYEKQVDSEIEAAFDETKSLIESTLSDNDSSLAYNSLRETSKNTLSAIVNGLDFKTAEGLGFIGEDGNLDSSAIKTWGNEVVRDLGNTDVQDALSELFTLQDNMGEMTYSEYATDAERLISTISTKVPALSRDVLDSAIGMSDTFDDLNQKRADLVSEGISDQYLETLSNADLDLLWTLNADDLIHNAEEAKKALEEAKAAAADSPDKYYNEYLAALETDNQGVKYDKMLEGYESIKEDYKAGRTGTDDFKAFAAMISPTGSDDVENFEENYGKFEKYFKDSKKGVKNFINKLEEKGYAKLGEDGLWDFDVPDMNALAHNLGISSEMAYALFDKMKEYNYDNNIIATAEEGGTRIGELMNDLESEQKRLESLTKEPPKGTKGYQTSEGHTIANQTAIDQSKEKIRQYNENIRETIANTRSLIESENEESDAREDAAVAAARALKEQQKLAEESGLTETAEMIDEEINKLAEDYGGKEFMAKVNFDVEAANQNLDDLFNSAWNSFNSTGKVSNENLDKLNEQIQLMADKGEDVSALAIRFNDLATATDSAFRMNEDGTTWNVAEKTAEIEAFGERIQYLAENGARTSSAMATLASQIGDMADTGADVTSLVDMFNSMAEETDYGYRMEITGELVAVEDYTGDPETKEQEVERVVTEDASEVPPEKIVQPVERVIDVSEEWEQGGLSGLSGNFSEFESGATFTVEVTGQEDVDHLSMALEEIPPETPVSLSVRTDSDLDYKNLENSVQVLNKTGNKQITITRVVNEVEGETVNREDGEITDTVNQEQGTTVDREGKTITDTVNTVSSTTQTPDSSTGNATDKTVTVTYEVDAEDPPVYEDINATAHYSVTQDTPYFRDITKTLYYKIETVGSLPSDVTGTGGAGRVAGTMISPAHANGTAYNVLNYRNAYANGNISLPRNEEALVNERGTESIIRDGKWMLLPPGMHTQAFKKGDIILSASQTKSLLKYGRAAGQGRAYADGTAKNANIIMPAHAEGTTSKWENIKDWFENLTASLEANIEMFKTRADTWQTYKSQNTSINSAIKQTQKLQKANEKAYDMYMSKANSVALSSDLKAKVRDGSINISDYDEGTRQLIQDYEEMYTKARDAKQAAAELKLEIRELAQEKLDNITERFDAITGVKISKNDAIDAQLEYREARGMTYTKGGTYERLLNQKGANLLDVITNLELEQAAYSAELKKAKKTFGASSNQYYEALAVYNEITQELYEQKAAYEENLNTIFELNKTIKDFSISLRERGLDKLNRSTNIKEAQHQIILEEDYLEKIEMANQALVEYSDKIELIKDQMAQVAVHSDEYQELAEELNNVEAEQEQLIIDMESWADEIRELDWKPFRDGLEEIDDMIDSVEHLRGLLNEDNFVSIDGSITSDGAANLMLIASAMEGNKQKVSDYKVAIQKLNEEYDNGRISEEKYKEELDEYTQGIYDVVNANESYRDSIIEVYEAQLEAENELLQDSIDKYKEKWKVQQDYVKWSRNLEKQNKNINALRAEAAALSGTTSAAGLAKLAQIEAQIKEAEKSLNEDIEDRRYDKISDGLDTLSDDADTVLDSSLDALKRNSQYQEDVVSTMLSNIVDMYSSAYGQINSIIANTGTIINKNLQNNISSDETKTGQEKVSQTVSNATSSTVGASSNATGINTSKTPTVNAGNQAIVDSMVGTDTVKEAVDDGIVNVDSISISPKSKTLIVGQSITLKAKVTPANARIQTFEWTSSDPSVATVSSSGVVKAIKYGSVTITCSSKDRNYSAKKATAKIKVVTKTRSILNNLKGEENNGTSKLNQWLAAAGYGQISRTDAATIAQDKGLNYKASELMVKGSGKKEQAIIDKLKPALLKEALKALPDETRTKTAVSKLSKLSQYISTTYGKRLTSAGALKLAKLLQVDVSNLDNYDKWTGTDRETVRKALASYKISFAKGGYVGRKNYIPVSKLSDNELAKIVSRGGDSGITGINPGEVILTQRQAEAVLSEIVPTAKTLAETFASVKPLHYDSATPTTSISLHYDSLLTVNGSVDKNALPDLQTLLQKSCDYTTKHISKELLKKGYKH